MDPTIKEKKICSKCGEIFRLSNDFWQIFRCSGIPYIKKEYSIMKCENGIIFYFSQGQIKMNSKYYTYYVNHHDHKAVNEIENNRCIMEGCDGKLEKFEGDEFKVIDEIRDQIYLNYFGDENDDLETTVDTIKEKN